MLVGMRVHRVYTPRSRFRVARRMSRWAWRGGLLGKAPLVGDLRAGIRCRLLTVVATVEALLLSRGSQA